MSEIVGAGECLKLFVAVAVEHILRVDDVGRIGDLERAYREARIGSVTK